MTNLERFWRNATIFVLLMLLISMIFNVHYSHYKGRVSVYEQHNSVQDVDFPAIDTTDNFDRGE